MWKVGNLKAVMIRIRFRYLPTWWWYMASYWGNGQPKQIFSACKDIDCTRGHHGDVDPHRPVEEERPGRKAKRSPPPPPDPWEGVPDWLFKYSPAFYCSQTDESFFTLGLPLLISFPLFPDDSYFRTKIRIVAGKILGSSDILRNKKLCARFR